MLRIIIGCVAAVAVTATLVGADRLAEKYLVPKLNKEKAELILRKIDKELFSGEARISYNDIQVDSDKDLIIFKQNIPTPKKGYSVAPIWRLQGYSEDTETGEFKISSLVTKFDEILPPLPNKAEVKSSDENLKAATLPSKETVKSGSKKNGRTVGAVAASQIEGNYKTRKLKLAKIEVQMNTVVPELDKSNVKLIIDNMAISDFRKLTDILSKDGNPSSKWDVRQSSELVKVVSFDQARMTGFPRIPGKDKGEVHIKSAQINDLHNGVVGSISFDGFEVDVNDEKQKANMSFEEIKVHNFDFEKMAEFSELMATKTGEPQQVMNLFFSSFKGYSVKNMKFQDKKTGMMFEGEGEVKWDKVLGALPTKFRSTGSSTIRLPDLEKSTEPVPPGVVALVSFLSANNMSELKITGELNFNWNEKTNDLTLSTLHYDVDKMAGFKIQATIGGINRAILEAQDPKVAGAMLLGATLKNFKLEITDKGAQKAFKDVLQVFWQGSKPVVPEHPKLTPVVSAVDKLVSEPKQKVTLTITPVSTASVAQLVAAGSIQPLAVLDLLNIDVMVAK